MRRTLLVLLILLALLASGCEDEGQDVSSRKTSIAAQTKTHSPTKHTPRANSKPTTTPTPTPGPTVVVSANSLNVREGPGTTYKVVTKVQKNDRLMVLNKSYSGDWLQVRTPTGKTGWVDGEYVTTATAKGVATATPATRVNDQKPVAAKNANLRAGPGTNYQRVGSVSAGDDLRVVGKTQDGSWYKLANGAWIAAFLVANANSNVPVVRDIPATPVTRGSSDRVNVQPVCDCSGDHYNCSSFQSWSSAQKCYEYCKATTGRDIHRLDRNNDGVACESLR